MSIYQNNPAYGVNFNSIKVLNELHIPILDNITTPPTETSPGIGFFSGSLYVWNGSNWIPVGSGGGTTPNLQQVTDIGSVSTNFISLTSTSATEFPNLSAFHLGMIGGQGSMIVGNANDGDYTTFSLVALAMSLGSTNGEILIKAQGDNGIVSIKSTGNINILADEALQMSGKLGVLINAMGPDSVGFIVQSPNASFNCPVEGLPAITNSQFITKAQGGSLQAVTSGGNSTTNKVIITNPSVNDATDGSSANLILNSNVDSGHTSITFNVKDETVNPNPGYIGINVSPEIFASGPTDTIEASFSIVSQKPGVTPELFKIATFYPYPLIPTLGAVVFGGRASGVDGLNDSDYGTMRQIRTAAQSLRGTFQTGVPIMGSDVVWNGSAIVLLTGPGPGNLDLSGGLASLIDPNYSTAYRIMIRNMSGDSVNVYGSTDNYSIAYNPTSAITNSPGTTANAIVLPYNNFIEIAIFDFDGSKWQGAVLSSGAPIVTTLV